MQPTPNILNQIKKKKNMHTSMVSNPIVYVTVIIFFFCQPKTWWKSNIGTFMAQKSIFIVFAYIAWNFGNFPRKFLYQPWIMTSLWRYTRDVCIFSVYEKWRPISPISLPWYPISIWGLFLKFMGGCCTPRLVRYVLK